VMTLTGRYKNDGVPLIIKKCLLEMKHSKFIRRGRLDGIKSRKEDSHGLYERTLLRKTISSAHHFRLEGQHAMLNKIDTRPRTPNLNSFDYSRIKICCTSSKKVSLSEDSSPLMSIPFPGNKN